MIARRWSRWSWLGPEAARLSKGLRSADRFAVAAAPVEPELPTLAPQGGPLVSSVAPTSGRAFLSWPELCPAPAFSLLRVQWCREDVCRAAQCPVACASEARRRRSDPTRTTCRRARVGHWRRAQRHSAVPNAGVRRRMGRCRSSRRRDPNASLDVSSSVRDRLSTIGAPSNEESLVDVSERSADLGQKSAPRCREALPAAAAGFSPGRDARARGLPADASCNGGQPDWWGAAGRWPPLTGRRASSDTVRR